MRAARLLLLAIGALGAGCRRHAPPPPAPPPPTSPERNVTQVLRFTPTYYRALVEDDARRYGLAVAAPVELAAPLFHHVDLTEPRALRVPGTLETEHLRLVATTAKRWAGGGAGEGFRYPHVLLSITSKSAVPVAYRVITDVDDLAACRGKEALPHDAIALRPGETVTRSECLWSRRLALTVRRVEVVTLPALGYFYVSRLAPSQIGMDARTAAGHVSPRDPICQYVPWRDIEASGAGWLDIIDFYARHPCAEYAFYPAYRFRTASEPLPARAP